MSALLIADTPPEGSGENVYFIPRIDRWACVIPWGGGRSVIGFVHRQNAEEIHKALDLAADGSYANACL